MASTLRGGFVVLQTVGMMLAASGGIVCGVCFDAHGTHQLVRRAFHGQLSQEEAVDVEEVPFFGALKYEEVKCDLPRFPMKISRWEDEVVYGITGVCDLAA